MTPARRLLDPPVPIQSWRPTGSGDDEGATRDQLALGTELDRRWAHRITVLHGPAGCGKSVAVAHALDRHLHDPVGLDVWLSCEPADATGDHLAEAIRDALAEHQPAPRRTTDLVTSSRPSSVAAIRDLVWALAPLPVCLVLDDVARLGSGSVGIRLIRDLVRELPANGHVLVVTRTLFALGFTPRLGDSDALVIDPALLPGAPPAPGLDLLRPEQLEALALGRAVGPLDDRTARELLGAPVQLERVLAGLPYVLRSGSHYLVHEAWDELLAGSEIGEGSGHEGAAHGAGRASRRVRWQAAALALARGEGDLDRAFHLAAGAGDWVQATAVLADACGAMLYETQGHEVDRWLAMLPDPWRRTPTARLAEALVDPTAQDGNLRTRLATVADSLRREGRTDLELVALVRLGVLSWRAGDLDGFAAHVERIDRLAAEGSSQARQTLALGRLMQAESEGDTATMWRLLEELVDDAFDGPMRSMIGRYRAVVELQYGSPVRVLELTAGADTAVVRELRYEVGVVRAWALWFLGRVDEAVATVDRLLTGGRDPASDLALGANSELMSALRGVRAPGPRSTPQALEARSGRALTQGMTVPHAVLAMAAAARLVTAGAEDEAREVLRRALTGPASPARTGAAATRALSLPYVLLGDLPPGLTEKDLGDGPRGGLAAARALLALREGRRGGTALAAAVLADPDLTPTTLLPIWAVELALRATLHRSRAGTAERSSEGVDRLVMSMGTAGGGALAVLARSSDAPLRDAARRAQHRLDRRASGQLVIRLMGPVTIERDGTTLDHPDWRRERVRALLVLLVRRGAISRAEARERLWPDLESTAAGNNLRVTLTYLHRVLAGGHPGGVQGEAVRADAAAIRLVRTDAWTVDVAELDRLLDEAERADAAGDVPRTIVVTRQALEWYRGPYLADMTSSAADELERDRLSSRVVGSMVRLGALLAAAGDLAEAQRLVVSALEVNPWSEQAAALEISTHLARGDRAAAARAYRRCRRALAELDVEPSEVVERVVQRLRQGSASRPTLTP